MLTNTQEENRIKCEVYWPTVGNGPITVGDYRIHLDSEVYILDQAIIQRSITIEDKINKTKQNVTQLQVVCWADHSAPEEELGYKMIELTMSYVNEFRNEDGKSPVVVHCR